MQPAGFQRRASLAALAPAIEVVAIIFMLASSPLSHWVIDQPELQRVLARRPDTVFYVAAAATRMWFYSCYQHRRRATAALRAAFTRFRSSPARLQQLIIRWGPFAVSGFSFHLHRRVRGLDLVRAENFPLQIIRNRLARTNGDPAQWRFCHCHNGKLVDTRCKFGYRLRVVFVLSLPGSPLF